MSALNLIANPVFGTSFGHMQLVFDADGVFGNGDEVELEVQAPNVFGVGDWDVKPVRAMDIGASFARYTLDVADAAATWELLTRVRDIFAAEPVAYELGIFGIEGQNSNSYIVTLAHVADIDIAAGLDFLLGSGVIDDLPGAARNVMFDQIDGDGFDVAPFALSLTGTGAGEEIRGGAGFDTFRFNGLVHEGRDTIRDFDLARDVIEVRGLALEDITVGGTTDALVRLGGLTEITLDGVAAADLRVEDFVFV